MIIADGFLPLHFSIIAEDGMCLSLKSAISSLKIEIRNGDILGDFPNTFVDRISSFQGFKEIVFIEPQSSMLIPLRMVKAKTGTEVCMSGVIGSGNVANEINSSLDKWNIRKLFKVIDKGDSPLEFSIRDQIGNHESVRLYPCSRKLFKHSFKLPDERVSGILLNRQNKGLEDSALPIKEKGGFVSLRIHQFDRYSAPVDFDNLCSISDHVIISTRDDVLKKMVKHYGIDLPRKWEPNRDCELIKKFGEKFVLKNGNILVTVFQNTNSAMFFKSNERPIFLTKGDQYCNASRTARFQGSATVCKTVAKFSEFCEQVFEMTYTGTESKPWKY